MRAIAKRSTKRPGLLPPRRPSSPPPRRNGWSWRSCARTWKRAESETSLLAREPPRRAASGRGASREAGLQQVAAGWRFPVEHLAGRKRARAALEHEMLVELVERNPAGGRDRARERRRGGEPDRHRVDQIGELGRAHRRQTPIC